MSGDVGAQVRFRLLGTFEVVHNGRPVTVGGATAQAVLVTLLRHPNQVRGRHDVARSVWGDADAVSPDSVYHYVSHLRRALKPLGVAIEGRRGYRIVVDPATVDAARFGDLLTAARQLRDTDPEEAVARLRRALSLWRAAAALPALDAPGVREYAAELDGRRLDAEETLATLEHLVQALDLARATGNRLGELNALNTLGHLHWSQHRYGPAAASYEQVLEIARAIGHRGSELTALNGLGTVHLLQGRHEDAAKSYQQVLDTAREVSDRNFEFEALHGLGRIHHTTGHHQQALAYHNQALELAAGLGQHADLARTHDSLAATHHALGEHGHARRHWQQALDILTTLDLDQTEDGVTATSIRDRLAKLDHHTLRRLE